VTGSAEEPEDEAAEEAGVESGLWRQTRQRGITNSGRKQIRRERDARDNIAA
jgi:hypothetical protein